MFLINIKQYKNIYDSLRGYLECITGLKFDPSCSNPSRLIRLPISTNWKDLNGPVACKVLSHNSSADFSPVFANFNEMIVLLRVMTDGKPEPAISIVYPPAGFKFEFGVTELTTNGTV